MKITVMPKNDAMKHLNQKIRTRYYELYQAVDELQKGDALVLDFDTEREAATVAGALSSMKIKGHRLDGCYVTKSRQVIVIGKN